MIWPWELLAEGVTRVADVVAVEDCDLAKEFADVQCVMNILMNYPISSGFAVV